MNWVTVMWPVMTGACLTMAYLQVVLWARQRRDAYLLFAALAASIALISVGELLMMRSSSPREYGELLRWVHVPGAAMFITLAGFVRVQYPASRGWLCWAVVWTRLGALIANFLTGANVNYLYVDHLRLVDMGFGASGAVGVGPINPWMALGQLSNLLLLVFLGDTIVRARRSGDAEQARSALRFCGSSLLFVVLTNTWHAGVVIGWISAPDLLVPTFVCVLGIMSYELSGQVVRATQLSAALTDTEDRLRANEREMEIAVRAAEIGPWRWDPVRDRFWLSELAAQILGADDPDRLDGASLLERVHPEDRDAVRAAYAEALRQGGEFRSEYRVAEAKGGFRWVAARGQVQFDAAGAPRQLYGVVADVTERRQQEERFRLAVEAAPTVMLLVDTHGIIALANRRAEAVFGYTPDELVGQNIDVLVPDRVAARHAAERARFADNAVARAMGGDRELHARRKDGTEMPVEIALNPLRIGQDLHVLASITDIGERRRLERESAMHRDELAHLSRVALLAELSGSLAHELNQPLTAILSNAQAATRFLAMSPPDLEEVRVSLANIVDSDRRAGEVIRRLRAMLRREAPDHRPMDVNEVVLDVLRIIRSDLLNRNTEVALELAPDLQPVLGDRIQLQQVLLNLVMNGCDAMADVPLHERELVVTTLDRGEGGVEIAVADCGRGIPEADREHIFSPFVTTKRDGMGLGLAVCRTIIDSHRGRLWAEGNDGGGATLRMSLPAIEPAVPDNAVREARSSA